MGEYGGLLVAADAIIARRNELAEIPAFPYHLGIIRGIAVGRFHFFEIGARHKIFVV